MASPKEQHDSRRGAKVVGTSRPNDKEPGAAHAAGTGSEPPRTTDRDDASGASRPADPDVRSSEEP